jgi:hypothetical protein
VLVSGGAGIVVILQLAERFSGQNISWQWYASLLILLVLWACFHAWQKERNAALRVAEELEKRHRPQLEGKIHQVAVGVIKERSDVAAVTVWASIQNLGMPSIARSWSLLARVPEKGLLVGILQYAEARIIMFQEGHDPIVHQNEDVLYNKIAEKPLQTGGEVTGVIQFHLEGVTKEDVYREGTVFVLTFEDVTDRPYFAVRVLKPGASPMFLPGMKSSTDPKLKKRDWKRKPPAKSERPPSA